MYKNISLLTVIPARGGSKGLPRKNIKPLSGKPLIAWTIEQARNSRFVDRVIVSTEDKEIRDISRKYGAEVPFLRPKRLASDNAKGIDVILHAIDYLENRDENYDIVLKLQVTSPLRLSEDIDNAIELLYSKNAKAIISVCEVEHPPLWTNILPEDGCMKDFIKPEDMNKNRQEFSQFYRINGAIFLGYSKYIKTKRSFFADETFAYIMPTERSIDIDSDQDFKLVEFIMRLKNRKLNTGLKRRSFKCKRSR